MGLTKTLVKTLEKVLTKEEVQQRICRLYQKVNAAQKEWDAVFIFNKVNQYYLTGTMQDGTFVLKSDGSYAYFVRRSYERAKLECLIDAVYPMRSFADVKQVIGEDIHTIYLETDTVTLSIQERLEKYFDIDAVYSADNLISKVRAIKSAYELECLREAGERNRILLYDVLPPILEKVEGINEADMSAIVFKEMIQLGYHGYTRMSMFQGEMVVGEITFGNNSIYPNCYYGPGGIKGISPATPFVGDRERTLKKGDLIFIDIGFGMYGYNVDCTQVYMYKADVPEVCQKAHRECLALIKKTAAMLKPGNIPSQIYRDVLSDKEPAFFENFMGFGSETMPFLGHGVGLHVDEYPVIAKGFDEPLEENMVIALEPKKGCVNHGMVGVEDTYIVTPNGGECITFGEREIIVI